MKLTGIGIIIILICLLTACGQGHDKSTWIQGWKETTAFNTPRAGAAAVVANNKIYLIGGVDGKAFLNTTIYAQINKDGSLGIWQQGPKLIEERGFVGAVYHDNWIYVVGGGNGPNGEHLLRSVEKARVLADGSLGPWAKESAMNIPRRCSKVVVINNTIYSFGGFGGALLDSVERSEIKSDGSLSDWHMEDRTMTMPRYVNGVKKWNSNTYVIGGHDQTKGIGIKDVEWSMVLESGKREEWKPTSSLQVGRYGLSTAIHHGVLYTLGGISGAEYLDSVEKSKINSSGELSSWQFSTPLIQPRASFSTIVYKDWIYVLGGTNRDGYLTSVLYGTFNKNDDIGFWGSQSDAAAYKERLERLKSQKLNLPNEGVVQQVIHASAYSYVQVKTNHGIVWLAGPRTELARNTRIRYSKGVYMSNFYSKELKRSFPAVTFVGTIQIVSDYR
jgi:hypothetical protein